MRIARQYQDAYPQRGVGMAPVAGQMTWSGAALAAKLQLPAYLVVSFGWTWSLWYYLAQHPDAAASTWWWNIYALALTGPAAGGIVAAFLAGGWASIRELLRRLVIWRLSPIWYVAALLIPPILFLGAGELCHWLLGYAFPLVAIPAGPAVVTFFAIMLRGGGVNEELGWRGFLLPALLRRQSPVRSTLVLTMVWSVWHWPLWRLNGVPHSQWPYVMFMAAVFPISLIFTWIYLHGQGSLLLPILFHTAVNTTLYWVPLLPPKYPGLAPFVMLVLLLWAVAVGIMVCDRAIRERRQRESEFEPAAG